MYYLIHTAAVIPVATTYEESMKILVAEDEPAIAESYNLLLKSCGHDVVITYDGEECLDVFQKHRANPFDLIILDYRMPKKDGVQVATKILSEIPSQRIILATAYAHDLAIAEMRKQANTQSVQVIQKPFEFDHLLYVVGGDDKFPKANNTGSKEPHRQSGENSSLSGATSMPGADRAWSADMQLNESAWLQGFSDAVMGIWPR
jgi:CheY-like chemotaxis protein